MNRHTSLSLILLAATGCAEYATVDEACDEKVPGGSFLLPDDYAGTLRINCYRKFSGVAKQHATQLVQQEARDVLNYVDLNAATDFLSGKVREHGFLNQTVDAPGYTGLQVMQRLTDPVTGTGYVYYDIGGSETREYIKVLPDFGDGVPSGGDAVDWLMRDPEFRQLALQPSFLDGAYGELELSQDWFTDADWAGFYPGMDLPVGGRAYYLVAIFTKPHQEHVSKPVQLPMPDQTDVPLYSWTHELVESGARVVPAQVGYAMTFQVGALDTKIFKEANQNQYSAGISDARITGPEGDLSTIVVLPDVDYPALDEGRVTPDGVWLRNTLAVYTWEPLQPSTTYDVNVRLATAETDWELEYSFSTVSEDPGLDETLFLPSTPVETTPE